MKILNIFPTSIGFFEYQKSFSKEALDFLNEQKFYKNGGNMRSEDSYILKNQCLHDLTNFIESCVHEYFMALYDPKSNVRLKLTQSWLNKTKPSQDHHVHAHPCSLISGCYYVKANKATDRIYFMKNGYKFLKFAPNSWNEFNSESWWFSVGTGELILFPSDLVHKVAPVEGNEERISLAFNTFPVGDIGDVESLTALNIS